MFLLYIAIFVILIKELIVASMLKSSMISSVLLVQRLLNFILYEGLLTPILLIRKGEDPELSSS